jgi:hypothetical protein
VVDNGAEGGGCGDSHENQVFCVTQNVSPDSDVIHYSWTYFEHRPHIGAEQHEQLIRWTRMMKNKPPVHQINAAGYNKNLCYNDHTNIMLFETYGKKYGYNAHCMEMGLSKGGKYTGKKWGMVGDGYHNVTRYGEHEENPERKKSLGTLWRNWHGGPLMYQFTADALAYAYAGYLIKAVDRLDSIDHATLNRPTLKSELPEPIICDPKYCTVDNPPSCLNFELPVYGRHGPQLRDENDDFNPYKDSMKRTSGWKRWLEFPKGQTTLIPKLEKTLYPEEFCRHLDSCGAVESQAHDDGWLSVRLPKMEVGLIALCGCCGKTVAHEMFLDNEDLEIRFDGKILDRSTFEHWPNHKCARILKEFPKQMSDEGGHLYLGIRVKSKRAKKKVRISHIFTL